MDFLFNYCAVKNKLLFLAVCLTFLHTGFKCLVENQGNSLTSLQNIHNGLFANKPTETKTVALLQQLLTHYARNCSHVKQNGRNPFMYSQNDFERSPSPEQDYLEQLGTGQHQDGF